VILHCQLVDRNTIQPEKRCKLFSTVCVQIGEGISSSWQLANPSVHPKEAIETVCVRLSPVNIMLVFENVVFVDLWLVLPMYHGEMM